MIRTAVLELSEGKITSWEPPSTRLGDWSRNRPAAGDISNTQAMEKIVKDWIAGDICASFTHLSLNSCEMATESKSAVRRAFACHGVPNEESRLPVTSFILIPIK